MTALRAEPVPLYLTEREIRVLTRIAEGREIIEMAQEMSYSERTVKNIVHDILTKLGARNRAHAVAPAIGYGQIVVGASVILERAEVEAMREELAEARRKLERIKEIAR